MKFLPAPVDFLQIVGDNSVGALAFNDTRVGAETLAALRARAHVQVACLYQTDGTRLAEYTRPGYADECPKPDGKQIARIGGALLVSHEIDNAGRRAGVLVLRYDLEDHSWRCRAVRGPAYQAEVDGQFFSNDDFRSCFGR